MDDFLTQSQINELVENFPLHSQDGKGLDTVISYKIYEPDRRGNGNGVWYIAEADNTPNGVVFAGLMRSYNRPLDFGQMPLRALQNMVLNHHHIIEQDHDFKPCTIRDLQGYDRLIDTYIDRLKEDERRQGIRNARDEINQTIYSYFSSIDEELARKVADDITDQVINVMIASEHPLLPAMLRVIAYRLGLIPAWKL